MADRKLTPEMRSSLHEFQRYLSDEIAPLMALDAVEKVISLAPAVGADQIQAWISTQYRGQAADVPVSDYLFHAVKKIQHLAELQLIPEKKIAGYLSGLKGPLLDLCPPADRQFLEANLAIVGTQVGSGMASAEFLYRQPGSETKLATRKDQDGRRVEVEQRMSIILDRLSRYPASAAGGAVPMARNRVVSEAVSTAVSFATNDEELDESLGGIRDAGVDVDPRMLFRYLGNSLPEWAVPPQASLGEPSDEFPSSEGQPLEAMKRLLTLSEDPEDKLRRFRQFVEAAVEQFNRGSLGRTVTMVGLAESLVEANELPAEKVDEIRRAAEESLDANTLRQNAETPETHYLLRKLLGFFPGFRPVGILENLHTEERRDRRRLLLALIEVHGEEAREAALEAFTRHGEERLAGSDPYFARNLLYVLNRIPAAEQSSDHEVRLADHLSAVKYPPFLSKEAIATLGQTRHARAAEVLVKRLQEYEAVLTSGGKPPHPAAETRQIIDRAIAALVKIGSDAALAAVVDHGLSNQQALGDTLRRLSVLGSRDLFDKPLIVERLIGAIRARLPRKVLGIVVQRKSGEEVEKLLEALSGTDMPEVLEFLETIRQKYSDLPFAEKAEAILEASGMKKSASLTTAPTLSGDLELFGLPNLMQNLSSMDVNGTLAIMDSEGRRIGAVAFDSGKISRVHAAELRGKDAFFQLFERAGPGTFSFTERVEISKEETDTPMEVTPLILEALRRFDELRLSKAIVPPESGLVATATKPVHDPRESDPKIIREVWLKASSGEPPEKWEPDIPVDSYRVWRLLRHWVENGALKPKED